MCLFFSSCTSENSSNRFTDNQDYIHYKVLEGIVMY